MFWKTMKSDAQLFFPHMKKTAQSSKNVQSNEDEETREH